ncbi:hypothetical protein C2S52_007489 [Perilla frutescens var. hirtella]|nr:hypothetical protein C2S51_008391 [Perilla frutescens var. frutescens]KAH6787937.1 hypothetical protein C2S52_007489 [Perilla frutescens var. hirtella]
MFLQMASDSSSFVAININTQTPLKLTTTTYYAWRMQFQTVMIRYDIVGYVDGSLPRPPPPFPRFAATVAQVHSFWIRQDQLILNEIVGSISPSLVPLIATATTSKQAWDILHSMYAKPSRGGIMQIRSLADALKACDTTVTFEELHEKLMIREAQLQSSSRPSFPASANPAAKMNTNSRQFRPQEQRHHSNHGHSSQPRYTSGSSPNQYTPRPYKGFCQLCGE